MTFLPEELIRYSRHLTLPEVGIAGQERIAAGRVLLIGAGGLGSPALAYLAAAGVGTIGIVDFDRVDLSNLQRQIIHGTAGLGKPKTRSAAERIQDLNPHVRVEEIAERITAANALELLSAWDLVVDGSDNFPTRYLINDACVLTGKPLVFGSIFRFDGQASVFAAPGGPCYRCLVPEAPPHAETCAQVGVVGALTGVIGSMMALEAIKELAGAGDSLAGRLLLYDGLRGESRTVTLARDPGCPVCGELTTRGAQA